LSTGPRATVAAAGAPVDQPAQPAAPAVI